MGLLEIVGADLGRGDLRRDRHHRHARAMAIEQAIDEMQIARTAASGADREVAGDMGVGACGEGRDLFMPHMQPVIPPCRRIASVKPLRLSPTMP